MTMTKIQATNLANYIRVSRPDWDYPGIMAALGKLRGDPIPDAIAALTCAADPQANTPMAMINGTYALDWNPGARKPPPHLTPINAVLATLDPHPDPDASHRGYLAAIKALEDAKAGR